MKRTVLLSLAAFAFFATMSSAEEVKGARQVLSELSQPQTAETEKNPKTAFIERMSVYQAKAGGLTPKEAAASWIQLVIDYNKSRQKMMMVSPNDQSLTMQVLFDVMPSPEAWPELVKQLQAAQTKPLSPNVKLSFRLLAKGLQGDLKGAMTAMTNAQKDKGLSQELRQMITQSRAALATLTQVPKDEIAVFKEALKSKPQPYGMPAINVPALVPTLTTKEAKALLFQGFKAQKELLFQDRPTMNLAADVALAHFQELKKPYWQLVMSNKGPQLYEKMAAKFAKTVASEPEYGYRTEMKSMAKLVYLTYLLENKKTDKANKLLANIEIGREAAYTFMSHGEGGIGAQWTTQQKQALHDFLQPYVIKYPNSSWMNIYTTLSAVLGEEPFTSAQLDKMLQNPDLSAKTAVTLRQYLQRNYINAKQFDKAAQMLRKLAETDMSSDEYLYDFSSPGTQLYKLGKRQNNQAWIDEGLVLATKQYRSEPVSQYYRSSNVIDVLIEEKRFGEAEALIVEKIKKITSAKNQDRSYLPSTLGALLTIYSKMERDEDVKILLDESPDWGSADLAGVNEGYGVDFSTAVARSLKRLGDSEAATKIVLKQLYTKRSDDPSYALLLELKGNDAIPILDKLAIQNRFEERPLIWKAEQLRRDGKLEEAEKVAREAISVDPSDGDSPKGDRMRAYAVLAETLDQQGKENDAKIYHSAVKAIRMSEDADDLLQQGDRDQAIALYKKSLTVFADAYCIQSRLAKQLSELGRKQEAAEHYRRAFELMPESFGRVETHCFGCEGVFQGKDAQQIAEEILGKMVKEQPNNPRVHYLYAYLKNIMNQNELARKHFKEAVRLDSLYLNAWKELQKVSQKAPLVDRETIALKILELSPEGLSEEDRYRYSYMSYAYAGMMSGTYPIINASKLYKVGSQISTTLLRDPVDEIYTLKATATALAHSPMGYNMGYMRESWYTDEDYANLALTGGMYLHYSPMIQLASTLIDNGMIYDEDSMMGAVPSGE